jgi:hypothetical protein
VKVVIRERHPGPEPDPSNHEQPAREEPEPTASEGAAAGSDAPQVSVRRDQAGSRDLVALLGVGGAAGLVAGGLLSAGVTASGALALAVSLGCLIHLVLVRPVFLLKRSLAAENARLRAALTCPYCRDTLPTDAAMACDRPGCGAFYHDECWAECRGSYGGCAIYACGSGSAHAVGRFGLQRHLLRLLIAALLFGPRTVKRLQESERESFREVWRRSRAYQQGISNSAGRTLAVGALNLVLTGISLGVVGLTVTLLGASPEVVVVTLCLLGLALPVAFMRLPLGAHFTWGVSRLLAAAFRAELAALRRADEGTFLARLAAGLGKKDG